MGTQHSDHRVQNSSLYVAFGASLAAIVAAWLAFPPRADAVRHGLFFAATLLGGACGLIGTLAIQRATGIAYVLLWAAIGFLVAVALPTLMSVGLFLLIIVVLLAFAFCGLTRGATNPFWHPRYFVSGLLTFTLTFWALFLLTR